MLVRLLLVYPLAFLCGAGLVFIGLRHFAPHFVGRFRYEAAQIDDRLQDLFLREFRGRSLALVKYAGAPLSALALLATGHPIFALAAGGLISVVPRLVLDVSARRRRNRLEAQVVDVIGSISATSKAGMNLHQSVEEVATRMPPPVCEEFAMILERVRTGQTLAAALDSCERRLDIPNLSLVIQSILVNEERGGRLPELLEKISASLREISRVEERVKTETSGIRLASKLMAAMPLAIGLLLYLASPDHVMMLFNTLLGNLILLAVLALDAIGFSMIKKLGDLEV